MTEQESLRERLSKLKDEFPINTEGKVNLPEFIDGLEGYRLRRLELPSEGIPLEELLTSPEVLFVGSAPLSPEESTVQVLHLGHEVPANFLARKQVGGRWIFTEGRNNRYKSFRVCRASFDLDQYEPGEQYQARYPVKPFNPSHTEGTPGERIAKGWEFSFYGLYRTENDAQVIAQHSQLGSSSLPRDKKLDVDYPEKLVQPPTIFTWQAARNLSLSGIYVRDVKAAEPPKA